MTKIQKYEYLAKRFMLAMFTHNPSDSNDEDFNRLGREGWELVSVVALIDPIAFTSSPTTKAVLTYFKRPLK